MGEVVFGLIMGCIIGVVLATPSAKKLEFASRMMMNELIVAGEFKHDGKEYRIVKVEDAHHVQ